MLLHPISVELAELDRVVVGIEVDRAEKVENGKLFAVPFLVNARRCNVPIFG
ncbi:MAG: hypothetical protein WA399_05540 [Acidobacteriaceae bacterium]